MIQTAKYSAVERLRDGREIEIRALRPADQDDMLAAVDRTSAQSLYRRFFGAKRHFSESEKAFFLNVDFVSHVALVAVAKEGSRGVIVGGGRYIVVRPRAAELAFAVVDEYQRQGIGAALMRHLTLLARDRRDQGTDRGSPAGEPADAEGVSEQRAGFADQTPCGRR